MTEDPMICIVCHPDGRLIYPSRDAVPTAMKSPHSTWEAAAVECSASKGWHAKLLHRIDER